MNEAKKTNRTMRVAVVLLAITMVASMTAASVMAAGPQGGDNGDSADKDMNRERTREQTQECAQEPQGETERTREQPVIRGQHLAVSAVRTHESERVVVIRLAVDEFPVGDHAKAPIPPGIALGNLQSVVGAAVVDDYVFPVAVGLRQDAVHRLSKKLRSVVDGR